MGRAACAPPPCAGPQLARARALRTGPMLTAPPNTRPTSPPPLAPQVGAIFLWSIISFDVTGVHYFSTAPGGGGSYKDANITAAIRAHNAAALRPAGAANNAGGQA
jgi:hypothetical protein